MNDDVRREFLRDLDDAGHIDLTDWETEFIESSYERDEFTDKQREVIDRMKTKYEKRL